MKLIVYTRIILVALFCLWLGSMGVYAHAQVNKIKHEVPPPLARAHKNQVINWFIDAQGHPLKPGMVNWEAEREQTFIDDHQKPGISIDTVVVHHTAGIPGMGLRVLSDLEKTRLYVPIYKPGANVDPDLSGLPIHSGHFHKVIKDGAKEEVFWPYHYFIWQNGEVVTLLDEDEVGWHAGKWDINLRSIAICLDGNYQNHNPPEMVIKALEKLVKGIARRHPIRYLIGHKETFATVCPGQWFDQWVKDFIQLSKKPRDAWER